MGGRLGVMGQLSSGLILGLSAVIYAVSYAALMFSGTLAPLLPYAITATLVTAAIASTYGVFAEEPTLVSGPDANTSSVLAGILATTAAVGSVASAAPLHHALAILTFASGFTAVVYLLIERFDVARMVRFIPFQVMAGFLASTGWLLASGALNMIAGTPLTLQGLRALAERPWRPELVAGIALAGLLGWLQKRFHPAVIIPLFMVGVSLAFNLLLRVGCPLEAACAPERWFFPPFDRLEWLPPWQLQLQRPLLVELATLLPSFAAVAFVGTVSLLLSLSSLELSYGRDFRLERALRLHGRVTLLATLLGGTISVISIGRSILCRDTGGGRLTGWVAGLVCLAVLLGLGRMLDWIPKAALGALVLYLGVLMLRQWLVDLRHSISRTEWLQVLGILACIVSFGYVVGFLAGLLTACIFFVVNYSRQPSVRLDTTLAALRSSVMRSGADQAWLARAGGGCRIGRFEGFVFFGVAHSIYQWYRDAPEQQYPLVVLDFSRARGIDRSASRVLDKIVRTAQARGHRLVLVLAGELAAQLQRGSNAVEIATSFDAALERAEDLLLAQRPVPVGGLPPEQAAFGVFDDPAQREIFRRYLREVRLAPGETLFAEGQASDEMYFVESGRLEVLKQGLNGTAVRLAKVTPGSLLGEIALYTEQRRTATVAATEPAVLQMLTRTARARLQADHPELATRLDHQVVLVLASSLVRSNRALLSLQGG